MKMEIVYEWTVENINQDGDIDDSHFAETLAEVYPLIDSSYPRSDVGLIRKEGNEEVGVDAVYYAYLVGDKLPDIFTDSQGNPVGIRVPGQFKKEALTHFKNL